jgi:hypothetical protein
MAEGLLEVGMAAESGGAKSLINAANLESSIDMENLSLQTQSDIQQKQMTAELGMAGGVAGYVGGAAIGSSAGALSALGLGAAAGAWAGPVGGVAGAALGFLVSKLF